MNIGYSPYDKKKFVGREKNLQYLKEWANALRPDYRLMTLVGPPGIGKSWLLIKFYLDLYQTEDRIILWMGLAEKGIGDPAAENLQFHLHGDLQDADGWPKWLEYAVGKAQENCRDIRRYDVTVSFEAMLDTLIEDIAVRCSLKQPPLLIVDHLEDLSNGGREFFEGAILRQFLSRSNMRLIISLHDETSLQSNFLRWEQRPVYLKKLSGMETEDQLRRLGIDPQTLPQLIRRYMGHPQLNRLVASRWKERPGLSVNELVMGVLQDFAQQHKLEKEIELLEVVVGQKPATDSYETPTWSLSDFEDYRQKAGLPQENIERLFMTGLLRMTPGTSRFELSSGLYPYIKAAVALDE